MKRILTQHTIRSDRIPEKLRLAVASDLHSSEYRDVLDEFARCDAILVPGDLVDRHRRDNRLALRFLQEVPEIAPVFFSIGNHENKYRYREMFLEAVGKSRVTLLRDESCLFRGIRIGGLSSRRQGPPDTNFLDRFEKESGFRLLMCHHPEVYREYVRGRAIDFTVCGHAHGGQIQLFGRGLYAPGQGLFPRLTYGIHDEGRMMVSRGMTNGAKPRIPRINNPCELIILTLEHENGGKTE
ncbi:MAG: metallophosphoesterase [Clostridia bacterium]|nr:metallophosphoesterase [Clostridia bacterium]